MKSPWALPTRWERTFKWWPVEIENDDFRSIVFFEWVWRRKAADGSWEYRFIDDKPEDNYA